MIINLAKIRFGGGGGTPAKPEDSFQETYTANGSYDITPEKGHVFSGGHVEVDVHPTESLSLTITESGSYTSNDEFNGYSINVDVEGPKPEETLTQTITENGSHVFNPSEGHVFNSASITVDVPQGITPTGTINISDNGTYDVTDKATAVVAVGGKDYRYKTGTPDVAGLTAIGWDADSIGYYGANAPHYAWENDNYKVSQENIDLYSLDDPKPSLYKDNPNVTFVPNKNMSTYFASSNAFQNMKYIKSIPWYDTSNATDMRQKFYGCSSLQTIPLLDTSNVTSMYGMQSMFYNCSSLQTIPLLDTSNVTNMSEVFGNCSSLTSIPQLDTSNVTNMSGIFKSCSSLTSIPQLNTSNVTNMRDMFESCSNLTSIPPLDTSNVTNMNRMFVGCSKLTSIPQLNTSNVTDIGSMFSGCSSLQTIPLLDTSKVTSMSVMFSDCSSLTSIPQLNTSNVEYMGYMFEGCSKLTSVSFTGTSKVTRMERMFYSCSSLQRVEGLDFSSLTSKPDYFFGWSTINSLTRFIVNGSINFSWNDDYGFYNTPNLDYESIKSILEAMNRTTNTNAKTMQFNTSIVDREGEIAGLVASCATKGWTVTGLIILERPELEFTLSPSKPTVSEFKKYGSQSIVTLTIDATHSWQDDGCGYNYYSIATGEKVRTGDSSAYNMFDTRTGDAGVTTLHRGTWSLYDMRPQSGEFVRIYQKYKIPSTNRVLTFEADLENN